MKGVASRGNEICFGDFALKALEPASDTQICAAGNASCLVTRNQVLNYKLFRTFRTLKKSFELAVHSRKWDRRKVERVNEQ
jgi:hypothetical protein